jgi:aldose 1-epimerase
MHCRVQVASGIRDGPTTNMETELFGRMPDGRPIELYRLKNSTMEAEFISYGAALISLTLPDRAGQRQNVALRFASLDDYVQNHGSNAPFFFGSTIGRYANRIANARFSLDGQEYSLAKNNGPHSLHGGPGGFYNVVWDSKPIENGVAFHYLSKDDEEGFPGNLGTMVRFTLSGADLRIEYSASSDKETIVNLTNHAYFNLAGAEHASILSHELKLSAAQFTPIDSGTIPTGEVRSVAGTALDFRQSKPIGQYIHACDEQLRLANGYDHNFVLDDTSDQLKLAAEVYEPVSGRVLQVLTTEPAIQFYSGNYLDGSARGKSGEPYLKHSGLCLETQHFPDSPNHPNFPSTVLRAGETFHSITVYRFSTR